MQKTLFFELLETTDWKLRGEPGAFIDLQPF